jgi:hypothetical protein
MASSCADAGCADILADSKHSFRTGPEELVTFSILAISIFAIFHVNQITDFAGVKSAKIE